MLQKLLLFIVLYFIYFFCREYNPIERDMDWVSYFLAKTSKLYISNPYPANTSSAIQFQRFMYDAILIYPTKLYVKSHPELQKIAASTIDVFIPVEKDLTIPARIYNGHTLPDHLKEDNLRPVLVWYHGGGMIIGSMEGAHGNCLKLANHTGFVVVNVDYRLAPEHIYPTPFNDAYQAFLWVERNIQMYGGDPQRLTIGGDSAGGSLALTVSARYLASKLAAEEEEQLSTESCIDKVCAEVTTLSTSNLVGILAVYPGTNVTSDSDEAKLLENCSGMLPSKEPEWMRSLYQGSPIPDWTIRSHYWFSVINTPQQILRLFPPTIFVFAKYDVLTPEGMVFMKKLQVLGVPTPMLIYNSIHAFYGDNLIPTGNLAVAESSRELLKIIAATPTLASSSLS